MFRASITKMFIPGVSGATLFSFFKDNQSFDKVDKTTSPSAQALEIELKAKTETGIDRLKLMFTTDEFGGISSEVESVCQVATLSLFFGMCYGGFIQSKKAYMEFMQQNQATAFKDHLHAKKMLQDSVTVNFARGAFKWGWRLCFFSTSYVFISTVISVYRGKTSLWEYLVAGCVSGALYKFRMGPRAMVVGGTLGTMLGLIAGGTTVLLLRLVGFDMKDIRNWQHTIQYSREKALGDAIKKYKEREDQVLFKEHSRNIEQTESAGNILLPDEKDQENEGDVVANIALTDSYPVK